MKRTNPNLANLGAACGAAALALSLTGTAHASDWRWTVTPYAWGTDVGVDTRIDGRTVVDETIPVEDLLEDVDLAFQGRVEARKGTNGLMLDIFYVGMSDDVDGLVLPQGAGTADLHWKMDMTIIDFAGLVDPNGDSQGFQLLYGVRVLDQRATVDAEFAMPGGAATDAYEASDTLIDALAGIGFAMPFTRHLGCRMQTDVSTGSTDVTWSAFPSLVWALGDGGRAITVGYRHMTIDFRNEGGLDTEMTLSGPVLGLRMSF